MLAGRGGWFQAFSRAWLRTRAIHGPIGWDLFEIGVWNLDLLWMLELGAWMFRSPLLLKWS